MNPTCSGPIILNNDGLSRLAKIFVNNFMSVFKRDIGLKLIHLLGSLSFFEMTIM